MEENEPGDEPEHKELEHLLNRIKDTENKSIRNRKKVEDMDVEILDLEARLENLKKKKEKANETIKVDNMLVEHHCDKKAKLEKIIESKVRRKTDAKTSLQKAIINLEEKLVENLKETMSVYENKPESKSLVPAPSNPNQQLLDRLIARKEKDFECPVCLITATVSIYSCPESHLI